MDMDKFMSAACAKLSPLIFACSFAKTLSICLNRFRVVDDLSSRVMLGKTLSDHVESRDARLTLYQDPADSQVFSRQDGTVKFTEGTVLDQFMAEVPGQYVIELQSLCIQSYTHTTYQCRNTITQNPNTKNTSRPSLKLQAKM